MERKHKLKQLVVAHDGSNIVLVAEDYMGNKSNLVGFDLTIARLLRDRLDETIEEMLHA